jgi:hypothetical protein
MPSAGECKFTAMRYVRLRRRARIATAHSRGIGRLRLRDCPRQRESNPWKVAASPVRLARLPDRSDVVADDGADAHTRYHPHENAMSVYGFGIRIRLIIKEPLSA